MILYSPLPPELIWQEPAENYKFVEHRINGVLVQVRLIGEREARVERILSTDPGDFLNADCQPGEKVLL